MTQIVNNNSSNTKRIVKNTVVLYGRMLVIMIITLYSSRIILKALGIDDYGLYNAVGGIVALLAFLKSSLTSSTQRFLSYEMGVGDEQKLKQTFSVCLSTHFIIAAVILVLAETVGLWFVNTCMSIPEGREAAANWVYQFSVMTLLVNFISVPYNAATISHEKMTFYAVLSIVDALLKLGFSFALMLTEKDRLILYASLMMLTSVLNLLAYIIFCRVKFPETHYMFYFNKDMFKQIFSFSGWVIVGQLAIVGSAQGKNILVNIFHSVAANAAMGVAHQVNAAVTSLTSNFQMAFQPQLTKSYAQGNFEYLNFLIYTASKVSFFLLFIVSLPLVINIDDVLRLWLGTVPDHTASFCILYIVASIFNALATPLWITIFATGNVKNYQLAMIFAYCTEILVIFILFRMGYPAVTAMVVKVCLNFVVIFIRLFFAHREISSFSWRGYSKRVLLPICFSSAIILALTYGLFKFMGTDLTARLIITGIVLAVSLAVTYFIGMSKSERSAVVKIIKNKTSKK